MNRKRKISKIAGKNTTVTEEKKKVERLQMRNKKTSMRRINHPLNWIFFLARVAFQLSVGHLHSRPNFPFSKT